MSSTCTCTGGSATTSHHGHGVIIVLDIVQCSGFESKYKQSAQWDWYCLISTVTTQRMLGCGVNCSDGELRLVGGDVANEVKAEWRCATTIDGVQCVTVTSTGVARMLQ